MFEYVIALESQIRQSIFHYGDYDSDVLVFWGFFVFVCLFVLFFVFVCLFVFVFLMHTLSTLCFQISTPMMSLFAPLQQIVKSTINKHVVIPE